MANQNGTQTAAQKLATILSVAASSARSAGAPDTPASPNAFSDGDGLVSFVNLESTFVNTSPQFATGRAVCDKVANFFASMRQNFFTYLVQNPGEVLNGASAPTSQWDKQVTEFIQKQLTDAGGFSAFLENDEDYIETQTTVDFSTAIFEMVFDAIALPEKLITDVTNFIQGVGSTLRVSWDTKVRSYSVTMVGICHEAVPTDNTGKTFVYVPKVKYYMFEVTTDQHDFRSPCVDVETISFNFKYSYYVAALKASVLDPNSADYASFVTNYLDTAALGNYTDAKNVLHAVQALKAKAPASPGASTLISSRGTALDLSVYPKVQVTDQLVN